MQSVGMALRWPSVAAIRSALASTSSSGETSRRRSNSTTSAALSRQSSPFAYSEELVEDALQRMTENSLTVLPVADRETSKLIGSISSHEVLEMIVLAAKGH